MVLAQLLQLPAQRPLEVESCSSNSAFVSMRLLQRCRHVAGQRLQLILCQLQLVLQPGQVQDIQLVVGVMVVQLGNHHPCHCAAGRQLGRRPVGSEPGSAGTSSSSLGSRLTVCSPPACRSGPRSALDAHRVTPHKRIILPPIGFGYDFSSTSGRDVYNLKPARQDVKDAIHQLHEHVDSLLGARIIARAQRPQRPHLGTGREVNHTSPRNMN
ncbi:hypothetical protein EYF80_027746 [Liparis tanakae]|uniref:Uncharacterized protein n=1 Tax=Liparis tanakae TaxID=230148 RepID=A0A4Z2H7Z4_9TELE|nr:hypothetical protein EYF80_027746 [Liparis tanakae]